MNEGTVVIRYQFSGILLIRSGHPNRVIKVVEDPTDLYVEYITEEEAASEIEKARAASFCNQALKIVEMIPRLL